MIRTSGLRPAALALATVLTACGGGSGGVTAGIDGTGVRGPTAPANAYSFGTVTAFGSVVVNGVHFDTSNATFTIDGEPGTQADLAVGDVVLVTGTLDAGSTRGIAARVVFDDVVEGPIAAGSIDLAAGTLVVLGQTIRTSPDTSFDASVQPASLAGLADGDVIEVTGFVASDGSVSATRIEPKPMSAMFEVTGRAANVDVGAFTFMLNALVVDYGSAMLEDFAGGAIAEGDLVEVKGATLGAASELVATRVEFKGDDVTPAADDDEIEVEGFVTRFAGPADFDVAGLAVRATTGTSYEGGTATDLGLDIKVEVEGSLDATGVLVAEKVDIRPTSAVRLAAIIDSVSPATSSFVILGITVRIDALTRIEDQRDDIEPFSVANLAPGDYLEVRGTEWPAGSGEILATLIERDDADPDTQLRGFVETVGEPNFTILGVTVATDGGTRFYDASNGTLSAGEFFGAVAPGSLVDVRGAETGPQTVAADEVEIGQP